MPYVVYFAWIYTRSRRFSLRASAGAIDQIWRFFSHWAVQAFSWLSLGLASLYCISYLWSLDPFFVSSVRLSSCCKDVRGKKGAWWKGEKEMVAVNLEKCPYIWLWLIWSVFFLFVSCLHVHLYICPPNTYMHTKSLEQMIDKPMIHQHRSHIGVIFHFQVSDWGILDTPKHLQAKISVTREDITKVVYVAVSVKACFPHQIQVRSPKWLDNCCTAALNCTDSFLCALFNPVNLQNSLPTCKPLCITPQLINFQSKISTSYTKSII